MNAADLVESEYTANWSMPDEQTMQADFDEYKKKEERKWRDRANKLGMKFPMFPTFEDFKQALRDAKVISINDALDSTIHNRSMTRSIEDLKSLVNTYYRPRDVDRIIQGFKEGAKMPYPIVVKGKNGMWIMAGNTRLDTARILKLPRKALLVDLTDNEQ